MMNDKLIAELACKANMTVFPSGLEKFVELIVKECGEIADNSVDHGIPSAYIDKHFGVE
jgi:hypothetical protein